jgi:hypothetical protein
MQYELAASQPTAVSLSPLTHSFAVAALLLLATFTFDTQEDYIEHASVGLSGLLPL